MTPPYCDVCGGAGCSHERKKEEKKKKKDNMTFEDTENNRMGYDDFKGRDTQ